MLLISVPLPCAPAAARRCRAHRSRAYSAKVAEVGRKHAAESRLQAAGTVLRSRVITLRHQVPA